MMGTWMPETCREEKQINKYIKQNCAPSWIYFRDYTGQQNKIKKALKERRFAEVDWIHLAQYRDK